MSEEANTKILKLLEEKILLKKEVFEKTQTAFKEIKESLSELVTDLKTDLKEISKEESISFRDTGDYEAQFDLSDETLFFVMHTNIFTFRNNHQIWRNKYFQQDSKRAYCGKILFKISRARSFKI